MANWRLMFLDITQDTDAAPVASSTPLSVTRNDVEPEDLYVELDKRELESECRMYGEMVRKVASRLPPAALAEFRHRLFQIFNKYGQR
ncbi:hypothetical protein QR680_015358 [Steinernema hermaphroditum]|uniref:Uncharacterized protein n=1 Tax=Steinernema hermaphroditum TaxID=289476 RepID=A0AA39H9L2_9BILA|nr:hypothetical protein QR680_015358 [Steinernema hermaphroditum]